MSEQSAGQKNRFGSIEWVGQALSTHLNRCCRETEFVMTVGIQNPHIPLILVFPLDTFSGNGITPQVAVAVNNWAQQHGVRTKDGVRAMASLSESGTLPLLIKVFILFRETQ